MRLLIDMNLAPRWVERLSRAGYRRFTGRRLVPLMPLTQRSANMLESMDS